MPTQYKIVMEDSPKALEEAVKMLMEEGWKLQGSAHIMPRPKRLLRRIDSAYEFTAELICSQTLTLVE